MSRRPALISLLTVWLTGLVTVWPAMADAETSREVEDKATEEQLLSSMFPSGCHFSGQFSQQKSMQGLPVPLKSAGDFYYSCDLGLVWHTSEPFSEAILYVNSTNNFRAEDDGTLTPLSGVARYIMSNIFVRLLKGDTGYFTDEFAVTKEPDDTLLLIPESEMMRKGLEATRIAKSGTGDGDALQPAVTIKVTDATGQNTQVLIDQIEEYSFEGKRKAWEQCETLYSGKTNWCRVLLSPARFDAF